MNTDIYSFEIGAYQCAAVSDGDLGYSGTAPYLFVNAPLPDLDEALHVHNLSGSDIKVSWTCLVIDTGANRVLVDTGGGKFYGPDGGKLAQNLISAGFDPASIDTAIFSHEHGDHIGGAFDAEGEPCFVNAHYFMSKVEWDYFSQDTYFIQQQCFPYFKNRIEWIDREGEIVPGIQALFATGHTSPGLLVLKISSEGDTLFSLGDIFLHPIHIEHPDWYSGVDSDPKQLFITRNRFLDQIGPEKSLVHLYHFDFPGLGNFIPIGDRWRWQPIEKRL